MSSSEPQNDRGPSVPELPGLSPTRSRLGSEELGALLGGTGPRADSTDASGARVALASVAATATDDAGAATAAEAVHGARVAAQRRRSAQRTADIQRRAARRARLAALVSLLGDESLRTLDVARARLREAGREARPALRRALKDESGAVRGRARTLLEDIERQRAHRRLIAFAAGTVVDLERGMLLLARYRDPRFDARAVVARLDALAAEVRARTALVEDPLDRGQALVDYLGRELGFGGSTGDFHHPDNIHFPRVLEKKRGMPLALSAVYVFVARRAGIRATFVPVPGIVMVRLHGRDRARVVDPYHRGQVCTERDLKEMLAKNGFPPRSSYFRDGDDLLLFRRQVDNLVRSARQRGVGREIADLARLQRVLDARGNAATTRRA